MPRWKQKFRSELRDRETETEAKFGRVENGRVQVAKPVIHPALMICGDGEEK